MRAKRNITWQFFTPSELSGIVFSIKVIVAGKAIFLRVQEPLVWTFLATAITAAAARLGGSASIK